VPTPGPIPEKYRWAFSWCYTLGITPSEHTLAFLTWLKEAAERSLVLEKRVVRLEAAVTALETTLVEVRDNLNELEDGPAPLVPPNKTSWWARLRNLVV